MAQHETAPSSRAVPYRAVSVFSAISSNIIARSSLDAFREPRSNIASTMRSLWSDETVKPLSCKNNSAQESAVRLFPSMNG
jgi:hypothetical protein